MTISVIIPIYNSEQYLYPCLKSVQNQSFNDFEVIMVDDGSEDRSPVIAEDFSLIDSRFILLKKGNGGASSARNYGLNHSQGEFIVFIDSDDYAHPQLLQNLYDEIINSEVDLVIESREQLHQGNVLITQRIIDREYRVPEEMCDFFRDVNVPNYSAPHAKIFRRSILVDNLISFDERLYVAEDFDFLLKYLNSSKSFKTSSAIGYRYIERSGSLSTSFKGIDKEINNFFIITERIRSFIEMFPGKEVADRCEKVLVLLIHRSIWSLSRKRCRKASAFLSQFPSSAFVLFQKWDNPTTIITRIVHTLFLKKRMRLLALTMSILRVMNSMRHVSIR